MPTYSSLRMSQCRFSSSRRPTAPGTLDKCPSALLSYSFLVRRNAVATHMCRWRTAIVGERCMHCRRPIPVTCRILASRPRSFLNRPGAGPAHVTSLIHLWLMVGMATCYSVFIAPWLRARALCIHDHGRRFRWNVPSYSVSHVRWDLSGPV